jgi:hypothetical protein
MKKIYSVDKYKDNRRVRPEIVLVLLILILGLFTGIFIYNDLRRNSTVVDKSGNQPILGEVVSTEEVYKVVETEHYIISVPENWTQVNSPEVIVEGVRYYPDRFQGTSGENIGRQVDVYYDAIPGGLPVSKILEVTVEGDRVFPREISPQCRSFTDTGAEKQPAGNPYPSKWNDINFMCRTSSVTNLVFALQNDSDEGLNFTVNDKNKRLGLVFMDHGSDQDNNIFFRILKEFKAK